MRRIPRNPGGTLVIKRKLPLIYLRNGSLAGTVLIAGDAVSGPVISYSVSSSSNNVADSYNLSLALAFSLDKCANYTDISNLVDRYKIQKAKVRCWYSSNSVGTFSPTGQSPIQPSISWDTDHDDQNPATVSAFRERMGTKSRLLADGKPVFMSCQPRPAPALYDGVSSAYAVPSRAQYVNATYTDVPHFGIKALVSDLYMPTSSTACSLLTFDIELTIVGKDFQ